jgi:conjugal transfer pilus assembly protein TrbC
MNKIALIAGTVLALSGSAIAIAQVVDGLDLGAIQRRADAAAGDAQAFADQVKARGDAMRAEARQTVEGGNANLQRAAAAASADPNAVVDLEAMVKGIGAKDEAGEAPQLIVFVSLSMPPESLKPLLHDVSRAGGVAVFQGFPGNSVKAFTAGLAKVLDDKAGYRAIGIDPRLFRAFHVTSVPAIVAVSSDFDVCDGFNCTTQVPAYDRISGNVTLKYALETFADGHGPGAAVATQALKHLGEVGG